MAAEAPGIEFNIPYYYKTIANVDGWAEDFATRIAPRDGSSRNVEIPKGSRAFPLGGYIDIFTGKSEDYFLGTQPLRSLTATIHINTETGDEEIIEFSYRKDLRNSERSPFGYRELGLIQIERFPKTPKSEVLTLQAEIVGGSYNSHREWHVAAQTRGLSNKRRDDLIQRVGSAFQAASAGNSYEVLPKSPTPNVRKLLAENPDAQVEPKSVVRFPEVRTIQDLLDRPELTQQLLESEITLQSDEDSPIGNVVRIEGVKHRSRSRLREITVDIGTQDEKRVELSYTPQYREMVKDSQGILHETQAWIEVKNGTQKAEMALVKDKESGDNGELVYIDSSQAMSLAELDELMVDISQLLSATLEPLAKDTSPKE